jgi:hypothetical protein
VPGLVGDVVEDLFSQLNLARYSDVSIPRAIFIVFPLSVYQVIRLFAPSVVSAPARKLGDRTLNIPAYAQMYAFVTASERHRDVKMYHLLREEYLERVNALQQLQETNLEEFRPFLGRPPDLVLLTRALSLLHNTSAARPFNRRALRTLGWNHFSVFALGAGEGTGMGICEGAGHVGHALFAVYSFVFPFLFPPSGSSGLLACLFTMKLLFLLCTLMLLPFGVASFQFYLEMRPCWSSMSLPPFSLMGRRLRPHASPSSTAARRQTPSHPRPFYPLTFRRGLATLFHR